jgi:hypothetical protein
VFRLVMKFRSDNFRGSFIPDIMKWLRGDDTTYDIRDHSGSIWSYLWRKTLAGSGMG